MVKTMTNTPDADANRAEKSESEPGSQGAEPSPANPEVEVGGRGGLNPTRYGDWEKNGRCIDF
jgi:hypothetical protein